MVHLRQSQEEIASIVGVAAIQRSTQLGDSTGNTCPLVATPCRMSPALVAEEIRQVQEPQPKALFKDLADLSGCFGTARLLPNRL